MAGWRTGSVIIMNKLHTINFINFPFGESN